MGELVLRTSERFDRRSFAKPAIRSVEIPSEFVDVTKEFTVPVHQDVKLTK